MLGIKWVKRYLILFLCCCFLLLVSRCKHPIENKNSWETAVLAPLIHTNLNIENMVADSLLEVNADSSLTIVYRNVIYNFDPNEILLQVPDTSLESRLSLDSLVLAGQTVSQALTLGAFARQMMATGTPQQQLLGAAILAAHGGAPTPMPPITGISTGNVDVDASNLFETATILSGFLDGEITNGFPVDLTNVIFQVKNKYLGDIVLIDTVALIPKNSVVNRVYDLSGKTVEGSLQIKIINLDSPGDTAVLIDTNDAVLLTFTTRDLEVYEATAIFPTQNLINVQNEVKYQLSGPELTYFEVRSGFLRVFITSTIEDTITFDFEIAAATDPFGDTLRVSNKVPPAPPNGSFTVEDTFDLKNYAIDLHGVNGAKFNTFGQHLTARIDSTGRLVNISLEDSIFVSYSLLDMVPHYVRGYLGSDTLEFVDESSFTFFNQVQSGTLNLESIKANIAIENGMGIDGEIRVNSLVANGVNGSETLNSAQVIGQSIKIERGIENPYSPRNTFIGMDEDNSNMLDLIETLPTAFSYDLQILVNPNGNIWGWNDFAFFDADLNVNLDLELPLSLIANRLILVDTLDFSLELEREQIEKISSGIFNLITYNGFPLNLDFQVYLYEENFKFVDSLFAITEAQAGQLGPDCRVVQNTRSKLTAPVSQQDLNDFRSVRKAIVKAEVSNATQLPQCDGQFLKIYNDYNVDLTLTLKLNFLFDGKL